MKHRALITGIVAGLGILVVLGWIVSIRTEGMDMRPMSDVPLMIDDLSKLTVTTRPDSLPVLSDGMPEFEGIEAWLNSGPLAQAELRGKVVLIDFWTFSCINCIRTLPYVTAWHEKYKDRGFTVIGVHTPEFAFEKEESNVRDAIARHGIAYPVALDNAYITWDNYANRYWPAHYLFDAEGRLRYYHFGEGKHDVTERAIQSLINESGQRADMAVEESKTPDFSRIGTPETYLGYERMEYLGSPEPVRRDAVQTYSSPASPRLNLFYFDGPWRVEDERSLPASPGAKIVYRYKAAKANLVMGATGGPVKVRVFIDGTLTKELTVDAETLYELHDDGGEYGEHLLELVFEGTDIAAYAFTFG